MYYFFQLSLPTSLTIKLIFLNRNRTAHNIVNETELKDILTDFIYFINRYLLILWSYRLLIEIIKSLSDN